MTTYIPYIDGDGFSDNFTVKAEWYQQINSGTSGSISNLPSRGAFVLGGFGSAANALVCGIENGYPNYKSVYTSSGAVVATTFNLLGNYALTGTPSTYPIAIIYCYSISSIFYDYTKDLSDVGVFSGVSSIGGYDGTIALADNLTINSSKIINTIQGIKSTDSPTFKGLTINDTSALFEKIALGPNGAALAYINDGVSPVSGAIALFGDYGTGAGASALVNNYNATIFFATNGYTNKAQIGGELEVYEEPRFFKHLNLIPSYSTGIKIKLGYNNALTGSILQEGATTTLLYSASNLELSSSNNLGITAIGSIGSYAGTNWTVQGNNSVGWSTTGSSMVLFPTHSYISTKTKIGAAASPTARLHVAAGSAAAGTAPFKVDSGTLNTTPEAGTIEYDGTHYYVTPISTRKRIPLINNATPSNGQIPIGNGTDFTVAAITGTTNRINVTNGSGTINLSTPQDIDTNAAVYFYSIASEVFFPFYIPYADINKRLVNSSIYQISGGGVTIGGTNAYGYTTIVKNCTGTWGPNVDPADENRILNITNSNTSNAENVYSTISMQCNPSGSLSGGRILGDLRFYRINANQSFGNLSFGAFVQFLGYREYFNFGHGLSYFVNSLNIGGSLYIGETNRNPTARLDLAPQTTTAGTAPIKLTPGPFMTTREDGAFEWKEGENIFFTGTSGTRYNIHMGIGISAPSTTTGTSIVRYYGTGAASFLGTPNTWVTTYISGTRYKLPAYL